MNACKQHACSQQASKLACMHACIHVFMHAPCVLLAPQLQDQATVVHREVLALAQAAPPKLSGMPESRSHDVYAQKALSC